MSRQARYFPSPRHRRWQCSRRWNCNGLSCEKELKIWHEGVYDSVRFVLYQSVQCMPHLLVLSCIHPSRAIIVPLIILCQACMGTIQVQPFPQATSPNPVANRSRIYENKATMTSEHDSSIIDVKTYWSRNPTENHACSIARPSAAIAVDGDAPTITRTAIKSP